MINISIVLYHNNKNQLLKTLRSILGTNLKIRIYLIDNSLTNQLKEIVKIDERIEYIYNNANLGYGAAHNIAMKKSIDGGATYHLVLNPDLYFDSALLGTIYEYMQAHDNVGNLMPKVLYPDGKIQHLCKLLPSPVDLIFRRFVPFSGWKEKRNHIYELRDSGYDKIMNVPNLSGCFMFLRVAALEEIGGFDERYFMYLEDTDLNRRIHAQYKTIYYPEISIYHEYAKESYKNKKLLRYHIQSAIRYFNKWGWLFDRERKKMNQAILSELERY